MFSLSSELLNIKMEMCAIFFLFDMCNYKAKKKICPFKVMLLTLAHLMGIFYEMPLNLDFSVELFPPISVDIKKN